MVNSGTIAALLGSLRLTQCANILLEGGTVISFDDATQKPKVLRDTSVLVSGNEIKSIFPASQNGSLPTDTEVISVKGKILTPGFSDTHRHLWQTAFKTIGSNTSLAEYFARYSEFTQTGTVYTAEDVYYGQLAGIWESLNAGVTSILDHAHHTFSDETSFAGVNASIESGARIWWAYAFHNLTNGYTKQQQYDTFESISKIPELSDESNPTSLGIAFDAFWDTSKDVQDIIDLAHNHNISVITTHALGGPWSYNNGPKVLHSKGILNTSIPVVMSHGSFFDAEDAMLLRSANQYLSITAESEMHYGHGHFASHLIQDQAALGIDTHFTFSADIVTQARIWMQKVRLLFAEQKLINWQIAPNNPMSVNQAFLLATRAGALAMRRPDVGVLVEGAKADIVVFDGDSPNMLGWMDPVAAVILHSNVGDVRHVLVNGEFKKRDGKLQTGKESWEDIKGKFLESAARIQKIWLDTPLPVLEGTFNSGAPYVRAETVDAVRGPETGY